MDGENSNYDYLMGADIDHSHPEVEKDVLAWGKWVLKEVSRPSNSQLFIAHVGIDWCKGIPF